MIGLANQIQDINFELCTLANYLSEIHEIGQSWTLHPLSIPSQLRVNIKEQSVNVLTYLNVLACLIPC